MLKRTRVFIVCAFVALAVGCGDDETATAPAPEAAAIYDITVGEFIAELQPRKSAILQALAADTPECENVEVDNGFVLLISAEAIDADQGAPLETVVTGQCEG